MDYTLVRYKVEAWEQRAYHYAKEWLRAKGFAVSGKQHTWKKMTRHPLRIPRTQRRTLPAWRGVGLSNFC
jgi:hypothetical protein